MRLYLSECPSLIEKLSAILIVLFFLCFPISVAAGNIFGTLCILALVIYTLFDRGNLSYKSLLFPICITSSILYLVVLIGVTYSSAPPNDIYLALKKYSNLLIVPLFFLFLQNRPRLVRSSIIAYCIAMGFTLLSVYLSIFIPLPWANTQQTGIDSDRSIFEDHIVHGLLMSFFALIALSQSTLPKLSAKVRLLWIATGLLALINLFYLTTGRTGIVVSLVALTSIVFFSLSGLKKGLIITLLLIATFTAYHTSNLMQARFHQAYQEIATYNTNYRTSVGERIHYYQKTIELIAKKPWLGYGTGSYKSTICTKVKADECPVFNWHPHNQYLFFWVTNGIFGLLSFLLFILSPLAPFYKQRVSLLSSKILVIGSVSIFACNSLINSPLWSSTENKIFTYLFLLVTLYALNMARAHSKE